MTRLALKLAIFTISFSSTSLLADTVTFAQFQEAGSGGNQFSYTSTSTGATFTAKNRTNGSLSIPVTFTLLGFDESSLPADLQGPQAAHMTFSIKTTQQPTVSGNFFQQNLVTSTPSNGLITFTRDTPDAELHETNLLTVSFDTVSGGLTGIRKGQTATLTADNGGNTPGSDHVSFSSSYLSFQGDADENLAFSFTSASPCFTRSANVKTIKGGCTATDTTTLNFLHNFTAAGTGTFASDPPAASVFAVPEPADVELAFLGLGMLALFGRLRRIQQR
jgi:hypothetical protein